MDEQSNKIIRVPITYDQRKRNELGDGYVPCQVSGRWLKFSEEASDDRFIPVDVMTMGENKVPRKICELIISKEDILRAINSINN